MKPSSTASSSASHLTRLPVRRWRLEVEQRRLAGGTTSDITLHNTQKGYNIDRPAFTSRLCRPSKRFFSVAVYIHTGEPQGQKSLAHASRHTYRRTIDTRGQKPPPYAARRHRSLPLLPQKASSISRDMFHLWFPRKVGQ